MISQSEKTNPIQTQFPKGQNERKLCFNKGLQKKRRFRSPKKQTQFKPNLQNTFITQSKPRSGRYISYHHRTQAERGGGIRRKS